MPYKYKVIVCIWPHWPCKKSYLTTFFTDMRTKWRFARVWKPTSMVCAEFLMSWPWQELIWRCRLKAWMKNWLISRRIMKRYFSFSLWICNKADGIVKYQIIPLFTPVGVPWFHYLFCLLFFFEFTKWKKCIHKLQSLVETEFIPHIFLYIYFLVELFCLLLIETFLYFKCL